MKVCRKCGHRLTTKGVTPGYKYYCPECDEDMFGIEARDRPVVVVKDFGDCRIATKVHARLRRNTAGRWQVDGEFYNPITGAMDSVAYCSLLGRIRSRKAAAAAAKPFVAKLAGWNWWNCSAQYAREVARNKGVFILRITKCKSKE